MRTGLQRAGPLRATRRAREGRELEDVADWGADCGGGPGNGRNALSFFTLEIDNRVESPSVNFTGLDCWTFFEAALAFARMLDEPETNWTPVQLLHYIEMDRYRDGECTANIFLAPLPRRLALRQ